MESLQCPLKREGKVLVFGSNHSKELSSSAPLSPEDVHIYSYTGLGFTQDQKQTSSQSLEEIQYCLTNFLQHKPF